MAVLLASPPAGAAKLWESAPLSYDGPDGSHFTVSGSNQFRAEFADWWRPRAAPSRPGRYNFQANRFKLGIGGTWRQLEVFVQLQHVFLNDVPRNGVGPGGVYWANTQDTFQASLMLRNAWARLSDFGPGEHLTLTVGRQPYRSGFEVPIADPHLRRVVFERLAERLLGVREYSMIGRSFDGATLDFRDEHVDLTMFGFLPTTGGFEIDGNKDIPDIVTAGAALTWIPPPALRGTNVQAFYYLYRDDRDLVVFDNRPLAERRADRGQTLTIHSVGGQTVHTFDWGPGTADVLLWGVAQFGDWQSQRHRAWAWAFEAGYQLPDLPGQPWLRAGLNSGSGDSDPNDRYHESFFQMLPTARRRARTPFYNLMNNQDAFTELWLSFTREVAAKLAFHGLQVNQTRDFAYSGGGATSKTFFGYGGIPANGLRNLAYLLDASVRWQITRNLAVDAYYGHRFGRSIVIDNSVNRALNYAFLECWLTF